MHQTYDAHIHQKDGAPVESIPFALKTCSRPLPPCANILCRHIVMMLLRNGVLGSTGPVHKPIYLCFMMVCRPALCPPCSLQRLPLSPTKGSERLLTVPYRALYRAQRGELIDPLPCNLAAMFLYRNPGHCFSRSAAKIAADEFLGCWRFCAYIQGQRAAPKKHFFLFARAPPSKLLGETKRAGYCSPSVAQIEAFNKRMRQKGASL